jgi:hypothetical protein
MNISSVVSRIKLYQTAILALCIFGLFLGAVSVLSAQKRPATNTHTTGSATRPDKAYACRSAQNVCRAHLGKCPSDSSINFIRYGGDDRFCYCVSTKKSFTCEASCECIKKSKKAEVPKQEPALCGDPTKTGTKPCAGGCIPLNYTCCANGSWCADQRKCMAEPGLCEG